MLKITDQPPHPLIAASVLSADFGKVASDCQAVLAQGVDLLHVDVMDGHFAPNLTMGQDMIRGLRKHMPSTYLDVHLMVQKPADYLESFAAAGANMFVFHLEVCQPDEIGPLLDQIHDTGMDAGIAINPTTEAQELEPWLDQLEMVLIMSVWPGRSGQKFMSEVVDKAHWLKPRLPSSTRLEMDGGLNAQTAPLVVKAGVDVLVSGSALFGAQDRAKVIKQLHEAGS